MKKMVCLWVCVFAMGLVPAAAQNTNLSSGLVFEGEPFITQDPSNPNHLVVAWMGFVFNSGSALTIRTKTTFDGGLTWSSPVNIPHESDTYAAADPCMAIDANGEVLLSYIDHQEDPYGGGIYFRRSQDGGLSWGEAVLAVDIFADGEKYPIDRPWFELSPNGNWVYLTTMPPSFVAAPNRPYLFQSNDGGATWSDFEYLDGTDGLVGNVIPRPMAAPAMGSNYAFALYPSYVFGQNPLPTMILSRQALGSSTRDYFEALVTSSTSDPGEAKMGYQLLVDPSNEAHLTAAFVAGVGTDLDIKLMDSYDLGETWTTPVRINDDPIGNDRMQDLVWADYDSDGDLCVAWRDRRNGAGPGYEQATEIFCAHRPAGTTDWSANFPLTLAATAHSEVLNQNGNDFMSLALENDTLHAVWGATTDGSLDIWYIRRAVESELPFSVTLLSHESSPFKVLKTDQGLDVIALSGTPIESVEMRQLDGRLIASSEQSAALHHLATSQAASGVYIVTARVGLTRYSVKVKL
jgi:hypothetical protein